MYPGEEKHRQANSAPSRKNRAQGAPLPKLNSLVARSRGPGAEPSPVLTTNFAGLSTKDQDASPTKSTRFASTWAQVRAENHIDMCAPVSPENSPRKAGRDDDRSRDRATNDRSPGRPGQQKGTSPDRERAKGNNSSTPRDKENVKPGREKKQDRERQTIRFKTPEDESPRPGHQSRGVHSEPSDVQGSSAASPKGSKKKPKWDNRLARSVRPQPQTTPKSWRRYEAELTHIPTVTSAQQVYKAYTGHSKQQVRDRELSDNDGSWSEHRPSTKGSQGAEDGEFKEPGSRPPKEYILTRNEAKMFIHMQNVYGSDNYRQQRKGWFFKKMTDAQLQELKHQAEDKQRKQQRREESKKRQKRQLMYVRRKFRREQLHRFRTQYVTYRVLEYERGDRDLYGLPEDSDDVDFEDFDDGDSFSKQESKAEHPKDTTPQGKTSENERGVDNSRTQFTHSEGTSQKPVPTDTSKSGALGSTTPFVSSTSTEGQGGEGSPERGQASKDASNAKGSRTTANKDSSQVNGDSLRKPDAGTVDSRSMATKNSKRTPSNDQTTNSQPSTVPQDKHVPHWGQTDSAITSSNTTGNNVDNTHKDTPTTGPKAADSKAKTSRGKQDPSATADSKPVETETSQAANGPVGVAHKPSDNASPLKPKDAGVSSKPPLTDSKGKGGAVQPAAASPPKASKAHDVKTKGTPTETNSDGSESKGKDDSSESKGKDDSSESKGKDDSSRKKDDSVQNKNNSLNKDKTSDRADTTNKDNDNKLPNKKQEDDKTPNKGKDRDTGNNRRTTIIKDNKGMYITTTKTFGAGEPPAKSTAKPVSSGDHAVNGHASDTKEASHKPASNKPVTATQSTGKDAHKAPASIPAHSRGHKPRPTHTQAKSEAEQKKQLERKYGKMFEVNTGPAWNPGAKTPKMEGIDTVVLKVTDDKGRTRLKKREVKDVVKEAKAQLSVPDPDPPRRSAGRRAKSPQQADTIRPASADTLDFDEDDDDDDEDVFERVRRKYNLQLDSDDDDSTV